MFNDFVRLGEGCTFLFTILMLIYFNINSITLIHPITCDELKIRFIIYWKTFDFVVSYLIQLIIITKVLCRFL